MLDCLNSYQVTGLLQRDHCSDGWSAEQLLDHMQRDHWAELPGMLWALMQGAGGLMGYCPADPSLALEGLRWPAALCLSLVHAQEG